MKFLLPISVLLANASGLIVQLLLPRFLAPSGYSEFALTWAWGQFLVALFFEWMRYGVLRFAGDASLGAIRREALGGWYLFTSYLLILVVLVLFGLWGGGYGAFSLVLAVCVMYALSQGAFDGCQTLSRALGNDGKYSSAGVVRSILTMPFVLFSAWIWNDGLAAVIGLCLAYVATLLFFYGKEWRAIRWVPNFRTGETKFLLSYGSVIALSASVSLFLFAVVKAVTVDALSATGAAGVLFAVDLSQKSIAIVGMAVNVVVSQRAIRFMHSGADGDKQRGISEQISVTAAFVLPAGVGFFAIQPQLIPLLVPSDYTIAYRDTITLGVVCGTLYAFRAFAVDALFVIAGRSRFAIVGPGSTILVFLVGVALTKMLGMLSANLIVGSLVLGLLVGIFLSIYVANREIEIRWPYRDLVVSSIGSVLVLGAASFVPNGYGGLGLIGSIFLSAAVYGGYALATDLCGLRKVIFRR
jgi:O-antigen/teichoic acid export membrane protein